MTSRSNHLQNELKARVDKRYLKERTTGTDCHLVPHSPFGARRVPLDWALAHRNRRLRSGQRPARESGSVGIKSRAIARKSYRRSRLLVKRSPSCRLLRGNGRASVPTVGDSRAARCPLYRRSRFPVQPCHGFQMSRMAHASRRQQLTE